jgi:hypothetical protein
VLKMRIADSNTKIRGEKKSLMKTLRENAELGDCFNMARGEALAYSDSLSSPFDKRGLFR